MGKGKTKTSIEVFAHWVGMDRPKSIGTLYAERLRGKEIFSFEYSTDWLQNKNSLLLDPDLKHYTGLQYLTGERANFGIFLDSSPDRWGRLLMRRRAAAIARRDGNEVHNLYETDYLLGVYDGNRSGALRFRIDNGPFLDNTAKMAAPPWATIRELEQLSLKLEQDDAIDDPEYINWLSMLIAPGSSLGGARPKASIVDDKNHLWIAKFPSKNDNDDVGAWEMVVYQLAIQSGIVMAKSIAQKFTSNKHTFLTQRFDRTPTGERMHFASAMTMLGYSDGQDYQDGASYLEMVDYIQTHGGNIDADLEQLWRRIVFSILVCNTDDHLRNHGFILTENGWVLSPAYDINPIETGVGLKLNISDDDNALDLGLALSVCQYFRLSTPKAEAIVAELKSVVKNWRIVATNLGISREEQTLKARAFKLAE